MPALIALPGVSQPFSARGPRFDGDLRAGGRRRLWPHSGRRGDVLVALILYLAAIPLPAKAPSLPRCFSVQLFAMDDYRSVFVSATAVRRLSAAHSTASNARGRRHHYRDSARSLFSDHPSGQFGGPGRGQLFDLQYVRRTMIHNIYRTETVHASGGNLSLVASSGATP
jgi:hypothetical protein